jgi:hypothetical protein
MDYTMRQITLFYREALRHENERQARAIVATNLGLAGGKEAKRTVEQLTGRN